MKYMLKTRGEIEKIEQRFKTDKRINVGQYIINALGNRIFETDMIERIGKLKTRELVEVDNLWIPKEWLTEVTLEDERAIREASEGQDQ